MLMTKASRPAIRTLRGWAISVLQEAGAIRECEEHGWMQDRADPHARERAFDMVRHAAPRGISPERTLYSPHMATVDQDPHASTAPHRKIIHTWMVRREGTREVKHELSSISYAR
jgi:hypothetical protein